MPDYFNTGSLGLALEKSPARQNLLDYKFFCFNGKVRFFKIDFGRFVEHHANYCDTDGQLLEFGEKGIEPDSNYPIELPDNLKEIFLWRKGFQRINRSSVWISITSMAKSISAS